MLKVLDTLQTTALADEFVAKPNQKAASTVLRIHHRPRSVNSFLHIALYQSMYGKVIRSEILPHPLSN